MMMYFSTLFDSNYIAKGLALYLSIERCTKDFTMYVMAMDRKCQQMLTEMGFERMVVDCIEDMTDPKLAEARSNRSRAEFCWTCGPYITDFFLGKYDLPEITYLDSDLMFFSSPRPVFEELEMKNASVGLAPHFTKYPLFGKYCVQFVYFKNDEDGRSCLRWWKEACLDWCYARLEQGKFGDQKYLDSFAAKFQHVCEIENRGVGIAYWNMDNYVFDELNVHYKSHSWPKVFFHYSGINIAEKDGVMLFHHTMYLTSTIRKYFVEPYSELMKEVYGNYLATPIKDVVIKPLDNWNYTAKTLTHCLNKFLPIDWAIAQVMKIKYKENRKLYSEKK